MSEQRHGLILKVLEERHSITVSELKELLHVSEATVRRDIVTLDRAGRLVKVFGGAVKADNTYLLQEPTVKQKAELNKKEKMQIAKCAAGLIQQNDFVYLDAGTTTGYMLDYLDVAEVTFVTNAVSHAQQLAAKGAHVILIGGTLKNTTEAVVGATAALMLENYHFAAGFFGTNGIHKAAGFTTPDENEALVKKVAMRQCQKAYILSDHTKFHVVSSVTFAPLSGGTILTDTRPEEFQNMKNMIIC